VKTSPRFVLRIVVGVVGATLLPFVVATSYLYYSRTHNHWAEPYGDFGALFAALFVGASCMYLLAREIDGLSRGVPKALVILAYVVVGAVLLSIYSFGYVCDKFGACL
jgi:hypothetical protein